jgi:hypothetical protein
LRIQGSLLKRFGSVVWTDGISLYSLAPNIYLFDGTEWSKLFDGPVGQMSKTTERNIFAVGGSIYHFNGGDWKEYKKFSAPDGFMWVNCYAFEQEVFILGNDFSHFPQSSLILHGK